jgi:hypothetical protein
MKHIRLFLPTATALLLSACSTLPAQKAEVRGDIASAINDSDLSTYTKRGCINSLDLWSEERTLPSFTPDAALLFLGDSYLSYNFSFVGTKNGQPTLLRQVSEATEQLKLSNKELARLTALVDEAKDDLPPGDVDHALHQTCAVFFTSTQGYFVVHPDENYSSTRSTDRAIRLMAEVSQGAP